MAVIDKKLEVLVKNKDLLGCSRISETLQHEGIFWKYSRYVVYQWVLFSVHKSPFAKIFTCVSHTIRLYFIDLKFIKDATTADSCKIWH